MIFRLCKQSIQKMSSKASCGIELKTIIDYLEGFAPKALSESWDNTGLLLEPQKPTTVSKVLLTNDLTEDVVNEGLDLQVQLIISYHPPIFQPFKSITTSSWKERVIGTCIENKIALYSPHTSWDSIPGGVNDWLSTAFDVKSVSPILSSHLPDIPNSGGGRLCELKEDIKITEAVDRVKKLTALPFLKLALARSKTVDDKVSTVGICAGSGGSVLSNVSADLYLTGEMGHHQLLDATQNGISVILCNHSDSERGFLKVFALKLMADFVSSDIEVHVSEKDHDPLITV